MSEMRRGVVKHFLAEPCNDPVSVDDFFSLGGSDSFTRGGGHGNEKKHVKMSDVSHNDNQNDTGRSTICEDYLIDSAFVDKDSDCEDTSRKGLSFEKSNLETRSSHCSGSESSSVGVSEPSSISNETLGFKNGTIGCQDQEKGDTEQKSPIMYTSQNRRKLQSKLGLMSPPRTCDTDFASFSDLHQYSEEASYVSNPRKVKQLSSARHTIVRSNDCGEDKPAMIFTESSSQKRSRKPPVRYIDEFTNYVPVLDERHGIYGTPMDEIPTLKTPSEHYNGHMTFRSTKPAWDEGHCGKSPNNPLASNRVARVLSIRVAVGLSKEFSPVTTLDSDEESDSDTPDYLAKNGFKNCGDRRKNQKVWTLPEVVKLVDGISQYGVGHWTEIQRLFFPKSTCRTPVDLRDKWRNLLKASSAYMQNGQEGQELDEELTKKGHHQLPKEILHRIGELSHMYPYPIKRTPNQRRAPNYRSTRK